MIKNKDDLFNPKNSTYIFAESTGKNRASDLVTNAFRKIYIGNHDVSKTKVVLLNIITGKQEITVDEIGIINDLLQKKLGYKLAIVMELAEKDFEDEIEIELLFTKAEIDKKLLNSKGIFNSFDPAPTSLPIYFLEGEYSTEEISQMISNLSDIYREIGGDGLKIKGFSRIQVENAVEPLLY